MTVRRILLAAAALASLATAAHAQPQRKAPPAARPCITDMDCETRHGPGNWFPHQVGPQPAGLVAPAAPAIRRT